MIGWTKLELSLTTRYLTLMLQQLQLLGSTSSSRLLLKPLTWLTSHLLTSTFESSPLAPPVTFGPGL